MTKMLLLMKSLLLLLAAFTPAQCRKQINGVAGGDDILGRSHNKGHRNRPKSRNLKHKPTTTTTSSNDDANDDLLCKSTPEENGALSKLFVTPRYRVAEFLDDFGNAIPEVAPIVELIRETIGDVEELRQFNWTDVPDYYSDEDLLVSVMAPNNPLPVAVYKFEDPTFPSRRLEDCVDSVKCAALMADVIAKGFDLSFSLVGLGGLSGLAGAAAGNKIAQRLLASPKGAQLISNIANIVKTGKGNIVEVVSNTVSTIVNEVGVNNIMGALTESADLSFWDYVKIGSTFVAETAAIFASGGAVLALKITKAGVSAAGLYSAVLALEGCSEKCTPEPTPPHTPPPTPPPTTPPPTPRPTPRPTPPPTPRPTRRPTKPPVRRSGVFGDPHLSTFDRLRFDCQAAGEFTTVTSLEDPSFQIQERFTAVGSDLCSQASVSTGVSIRDLNQTVQISTPRSGNGTGLNMIGDCPIDFYVNQAATSFGADLGAESEATVSLSGSRINIEYTQTFVSMDVTVRESSSFGCHFLVQVSMPTTYRTNETILGLLGTPNGMRNDDWIAPDGTIISAPTTEEESIFSTSYNYCVENWCVQDELDSIFTYADGESFDAINACDEDYADEIEDAVTNPSDELVAICGTNVFCLVDGVCGNLDDALNALEDEEIIEADQEETNPTPSAAPSFSSSPSTPRPSNSSRPTSTRGSKSQKSRSMTMSDSESIRS